MTEPDHINYIDIELMEKMCHPMAVALFDSDAEPIATFNEHNKARLEAALANPRHDFYSNFTRKAAILYYGINKSHSFPNGNKRTATATLLIFLYINDFELAGEKTDIDNYLVTLATRVAQSKGSQDKDEFLTEIEAWLEKSLVPIKKSEQGFFSYILSKIPLIS